MKKLLLYYNFILLSIMTLMGFMGTSTIPQLISATLFFPLAAYCLLLVLPRKKRALIVPAEIIEFEKLEEEENIDEKKKPAELKLIKSDRKMDIDRRMFLKLIGSAGISVFFLSIFTQKAEGAFFGSVPGPGTISVKDTSGTKIDPAEKHPTDGYRISQLDDSSPAYYGFTEKAGNWFIMKEDSSGNYRYAKGASSFSTNWTNRAALSYDYYDVIF
jgi:hypothetical protein